MQHAADPWVAFNSDGTALFAYLASDAAFSNSDNLAVSRSTDGGTTWSEPAYVPGGIYDREFLAEETSGPHAGRIYSIGKINVNRLDGLPFQVIGLSYSSDGAASFSPPHLFVPPDDHDVMYINAAPVVTRAGKVVIPFVTVIRPQPSETTLHYSLWVTDSTLSKPLLITPRIVPKGHVQQNMSVPSSAIDRSGGAYDGRIYLAWTVPNDDGYAVRVWASPDGGSSWLPPVTVSDNRGPAAHVNPAVAVDGAGNVAVAWYDRREDPTGNCHQLYLSASVDGGATFVPNSTASKVQTCVNAPGNWVPNAGARLSSSPTDAPNGAQAQVITLTTPVTRFGNAGETLGLAANPEGGFYAAFIHAPNGVMQLYGLSFSVEHENVPPVEQQRSDVDITSAVKLDVTDPEVDFAAHQVSIRLRIENTTPRPLRGPFTLIAEQVKSGLKDLRVANSENHLTGVGAIWKIGDFQALPPRALTAPITLRFGFNGGVPVAPDGPLQLSFRVLGERQ
jgi:hypothetical protein